MAAGGLNWLGIRRWKFGFPEDVGLTGVWLSKSLRKGAEIRMFNACVKSVLLYGCETWFVIKGIQRKIQTFVNRCLRYILRRYKFRNNEIRIFNACVKFVLLYGCETWLVTKGIQRKIQIFVNRCLRYILRRYKFRNNEIRIFNACVISVLLYGCKTWLVTKEIQRKIQTFVNRCLRYILKNTVARYYSQQRPTESNRTRRYKFRNKKKKILDGSVTH